MSPLLLSLIILTTQQPAPARPAVMAVAGTYQIDHTSRRTGCDASSAAPSSPAQTHWRTFGVVSHAPGATHLVIESATPAGPRNLAARLSGDGAFAVRPGDGEFGPGRFSVGGFEVSESTRIGSCVVEDHWSATRHDAANTIGPLLPDGGASFLVTRHVTEDTCDPAHAMSASANPRAATGASIARTPTGQRFVLNDHGTRNLFGSVDEQGRFTLDSQTSLVMDRIQATDTFSGGQFNEQGFVLLVVTTLDANPYREGGACRITTRWRATRLEGGAR